MWKVQLSVLMAGGLGLASLAQAAPCRPDQLLKRIGSAQTGSAVVRTGGAEVRLLSMTCDSNSACQAGVYDGDELSDTTNADHVIEPGAAANTSVLVPQGGYFDPPLSFNTGIVFIDSGNVAAISFFECQQR